jgi:hypothetical protein
MYRIIYPNNNTISVIIPSNNISMDVHEIARKYVPSGLKYKIINIEDIPSDRTFREAWIYDFNNYDGIGENLNYD